MPYVSHGRRATLHTHLQPLVNYIEGGQDVITEGDLNYIITRLLVACVKAWRPSYSTFNRLMGVLSCAGHELYRRLVARYEDRKMVENGDVFCDH